MKYKKGQIPVTCKLLIILHIILGIGAVFGGGALTIDPEGTLLGMPITILDQSPFHNFLIPGIILLLFLGVLPLIIAFNLINQKSSKIGDALNFSKDIHWSWSFSIYISFILIIWLCIQIYMINGISNVHLIYMTLGLLIQAITILPSVQDYYRLNSKEHIGH